MLTQRELNRFWRLSRYAAFRELTCIRSFHAALAIFMLEPPGTLNSITRAASDPNVSRP